MEYTRAEQQKTLAVEQLKSDGIIKPYSGRYGNGYIVLSPCWVSTTYCYITYYVER